MRRVLELLQPAVFQAIVRSDTLPEIVHEDIPLSHVKSGHLLFLLNKQPVDEVFGVGGDVVECLVLVIVLGDRHISHRLQVRVTHERRQPRQPYGELGNAYFSFSQIGSLLRLGTCRVSTTLHNLCLTFFRAGNNLTSLIFFQSRGEI